MNVYTSSVLPMLRTQVTHDQCCLHVYVQFFWSPCQLRCTNKCATIIQGWDGVEDVQWINVTLFDRFFGKYHVLTVRKSRLQFLNIFFSLVVSNHSDQRNVFIIFAHFSAGIIHAPLAVFVLCAVYILWQLPTTSTAVLCLYAVWAVDIWGGLTTQPQVRLCLSCVLTLTLFHLSSKG